jgi:hypothetical protein
MIFCGRAGASGNSSDSRIDMKRKTTRSVKELTTLDEFLAQEGKREEFEAVAIKDELAWQTRRIESAEPVRQRVCGASAGHRRQALLRVYRDARRVPPELAPAAPSAA